MADNRYEGLFGSGNWWWIWIIIFLFIIFGGGIF